MSSTSVPKVNRDDSGLPMENPRLPQEIENPESVDDACKIVVRDVTTARSDSDISADATEKTEALRKIEAKLSAKVVSPTPSSSDGVAAESGETEASSDTSNGNGGKATSVLKPSPSVGMSMENLVDSPIVGNGKNGGGENGFGASMMEEAWGQLRRSYVYYKEQRVGAIAAIDDSGIKTLNYNQVLVRYFVPFGLACLMKPDADVEIVKNFLLKTFPPPPAGTGKENR